MSKPRIGRILELDDPATRDAVHVPIMPVIVGEALRPGDAVSFLDDGRVGVVRPGKRAVGLVDPYLSMDISLAGTVIEPGERFYLFLKPESTYRLWHEWTHPMVDGPRKS